MESKSDTDLQEILSRRYRDAPNVADLLESNPLLGSMVSRGSCRSFSGKEISSQLLDLLCSVAFASPSKSDLQQRDIILLYSSEQRARLSALVPGQSWVAAAPMLVVFCGNNRRQRLLHEWHNMPFGNDHLDAVFNATADAAIALGAFVTAAEAMGLGCCPISAIRNEAKEVSKLLNLPPNVFPLAGLAIGYPSGSTDVSMRLPLEVTQHVDRYGEEYLQTQIEAYDADRRVAQPYENQRFTAIFGESADYGWSEDKVRQYSQPERADFGAYLRAQGFCMD